MPFAELDRLHKAYMTAMRHHDFIYDIFFDGMYDKDHSLNTRALNRRIFWLGTHCEVAREIMEGLGKRLSLPVRELHTARRYAASITALARSGLEMFRAYVETEPELLKQYEVTLYHNSRRIYG